MNFKPYETVYVYLNDDWCHRPAQGRYLSGDTFELLPTEGYATEDEEWEFVPGSIVKCAFVSKINAAEYRFSEDSFEEGEEILVACEKVEG